MGQKREIAPKIRRVHSRKYKERRKYGKSTYAMEFYAVLHYCAEVLRSLSLQREINLSFRLQIEVHVLWVPRKSKDAKCTEIGIAR